MKRRNNSYHFIDVSPYPLYTAISILSIMINSILMINNYNTGFNNNIINIIAFLILNTNLYLWWKDIIKESLYKGEHTSTVSKGLKLGFLLFLISEFLIFSSFFFGYFYISLIPDILFSTLWPPKAILSINSYSIPLLNTAILFFSGLTITAAQYFILNNNKSDGFIYIFLTLFLALFFLFLQSLEYFASPFSINDSVFGSSFFLLTGFHGLHVIIGFLFILFSFFRFNSFHFSSSGALHFSFSALYYHFVDIIWIFLFFSLYLWGS